MSFESYLWRDRWIESLVDIGLCCRDLVFIRLFDGMEGEGEFVFGGGDMVRGVLNEVEGEYVRRKGGAVYG